MSNTSSQAVLDGVRDLLPTFRERADVTLHQILVHMTVETARHAGHIDIVREMIDNATGMRPEATNLPDDDYDWEAHVARVEAAARAASGA